MKMRVYKCDSCNKVITDPYTVNMREFYLGFDADCLGLIGIAIPFECKRKIKIHHFNQYVKKNSYKKEYYSKK